MFVIPGLLLTKEWAQVGCLFIPFSGSIRALYSLRVVHSLRGSLIDLPHGLGQTGGKRK